MPNNYILLETIALTQSAASVTFDNLPTSGYTDLKIVFSTRDNNGQPQNGIFVSINGSTANFTNRYLLGSGSAASSGSIARFLGYSSGAGATANTFSNGELYFPNYRSSNNKSFSSDNVQETNASTAYMVMSAHLWSQTAAITSISLIADSASFVAGSTFSLYGIAALGTTPVLAPKATGGNIVANDGTYWYHAFTSSGAFVPQTGLTADILQIAGGGGGGCVQAGGGGAGGLLAYSSQALTTTTYNLTVGGGGVGSTAVSVRGGSGTNSQFASLTASAGGGAAGTYDPTGSNGTQNALSGGSGGGGGSTSGGNGSGAAASPSGQGNAGGGGGSDGATYRGGGGGGGAGSAGANVSSAAGGTGGNGGSGSTSYSTWASATNTGVSSGYAGGGGGGGGTRGTATNGGGNGAGSGQISVAGTANTGGGGGGGTFVNTTSPGDFGAAGGSGIIIVRYPIA
jgi:hypothetical protein